MTALDKSPYKYDPQMPRCNNQKIVEDAYGRRQKFGDLIFESGLEAIDEYSSPIFSALAVGAQAVMTVLPKGFLGMFTASVYNRLAAKDPVEARRFLNEINCMLDYTEEEIRGHFKEEEDRGEYHPKWFTPELVIGVQNFVRQVRDKAIPRIPSLNMDVIDAEK